MPIPPATRLPAGAAWRPTPGLEARVAELARSYRALAAEELGRLTAAHFPELQQQGGAEFRKMVELSAKMAMVGHACSEVAGYAFTAERRTLSTMYGGCCFLADSFLDDYGETVAADYLDRFERLLTRGWFDVRNDRERLFYVVTTRLFTGRNVLEGMLRQAIFALFLAQRRDVALRQDVPAFRALPRTRQLNWLRRCARDRSGHAILVLTRLVAPELGLWQHHLLFLAGALIMHIDDHGDCHADRRSNRVTYMNQVRDPEAALRRIYEATVRQLQAGLTANAGRELLCAFLHRYYLTRLDKHRQERDRGALSWAVYE
jgi:hypothetical protein